MELIDKLVKNMDERRLALNWSMEDLARAANIPYSTVSKIRQKVVKDPSLKTAVAIAKALHCTVDKLIR